MTRTWLTAVEFVVPKRSKNPLAYLGMLAFVCFLVLGITGILLQVYYVPDFASGYDSVASITNVVPYGYALRSIHYYASDLMVVFAIAHFFYTYFTRKYALHGEVLWITGIVFGVFVIIEAYTGYVLIMNDRALFAANIGTGLLHSIDPVLNLILIGSSYNDLVLRVDVLHILAIPAVFLLLALLHFPKKLTVDVAGISIALGSIFVIGAFFPPDLGAKFVAGAPSQITVPEWYLSGLYALLRTGLPAFVAGVLIPFIFLFSFLILPFHDGGRDNGPSRRVLTVSLGATALAHVSLMTIWGLRAGNLLGPLASEGALAIDPLLFFGSLAAIAAAVYALTSMAFRYRRRGELARPRSVTQPAAGKMPAVPYRMALATLAAVLVLQVGVCVKALSSDLQGIGTLALLGGGLVLVNFGTAVYLYRYFVGNADINGEVSLVGGEVAS
jgi:ubiquinol-cytochrome c reductase cytochrome b subunit